MQLADSGCKTRKSKRRKRKKNDKIEFICFVFIMALIHKGRYLYKRQAIPLI